jgi:hypothetical protein
MTCTRLGVKNSFSEPVKYVLSAILQICTHCVIVPKVIFMDLFLTFKYPYYRYTLSSSSVIGYFVFAQYRAFFFSFVSFHHILTWRSKAGIVAQEMFFASQWLSKHSRLLGFWTLSIIWYSKKHKSVQHFRNGSFSILRCGVGDIYSVGSIRKT